MRIKPKEQNLERLLRKLIKQQPVSASDLLAHWQGLGAAGDRVFISTLNKQNGWEPFVLWSESEPQVREKLKAIADRPGISESGLLVLKASRLVASEGETPRSQSLWILQTVRNGESQDWPRATEWMLQDEDFFYATLALLELEESQQTAHFFSRLLEQKLSREQDQAIRRSLYRFRLKGFEPPQQESTTPVAVEPKRTEIFLFAQNRLPLWQPFFYYRSTGSRGDWFFAEITEGTGFEIVQQQRDIRMNEKRMQQIADHYAAEFGKGTGVKMPFVRIPPVHARFFLSRSFDLITGSEDFQKYLGTGATENPFEEWTVQKETAESDALMLLNHDYFQLWVAEDSFLDRLFEQLREVEQAPIILPEHQTRQRIAEVMKEMVQEYFSGTRRSAWRLALERASYFLRESEPDLAPRVFGFASQFSQEGFDPAENAFARALLDRSLKIQKERKAREEQEQKRSSLIMTPQEFERSLQKK